MRKTKIICTLGPAVDSEQAMRRLISGGMDAVRINAAHGTHASHRNLLDKLKRVREELGRPVAAILDAGGPEIRIGTFVHGPIVLEKGAQFILTTENIPGDERRVSVTYADLHRELTEGCRILLDDGLVELTVSRVEGRNIICTVENGGELSDSKSVNIPGVSISLPCLSRKDKQDIQFAVEQDFDFLMISFVRRASDVADVRAELKKYGGEKIHILAKIENREGINNLDEIIAAADGVVVARGDLGVEIPACEVPAIQKEIIRRATARGKDVIITTQMLDSMTRNPRPTRAEVSDVANAVYDDASCVMLTGETASGKYPFHALQTLVDTVTATEKSIDGWEQFRKKGHTSDGTIDDAITHSCCLTAMDLGAKVILAATVSGGTARRIARFRPACSVVALTVNERVWRQLSVAWGVYPCLCDPVDSAERLFSLAVECARREGVAEMGDTVVIAAGQPIGQSGTTNLIKAQVVEDPA